MQRRTRNMLATALAGALLPSLALAQHVGVHGAVNAQTQGTAHAATHSAVVTRDMFGTVDFGTLDADGDGRISSGEAAANAGFNTGFAARDGNGDGFITDAEFRAHAKAEMPQQP